MNKIIYTSLIILLASCTKGNQTKSDFSECFIEANPKQVPIIHSTTSCRKIKFGIFKVVDISDIEYYNNNVYSCCPNCISEEKISELKKNNTTTE